MEKIQNKPPLPNATAVLVLGICSIVFGCQVIGFVLGLIGLSLSKKDKVLYDANPEAYSGYGNLNAGRVMSIIGIVMGSFAILALLIWLIAFGAALSIFSEFAF